MSHEKRRFSRENLEVRVDLNTGRAITVGLSENISTGGLFVATYNTPRLGEKLQISFFIPVSDFAIDTTGIVRWIRPHEDNGRRAGFGLEFASIKAEDLRAIEFFVDHSESGNETG